MSGCLELYPAILVKLKGILKLTEEDIVQTSFPF